MPQAWGSSAGPWSLVCSHRAGSGTQSRGGAHRRGFHSQSLGTAWSVFCLLCPSNGLVGRCAVLCVCVDGSSEAGHRGASQPTVHIHTLWAAERCDLRGRAVLSSPEALLRAFCGTCFPQRPQMRWWWWHV